jgi:hypothetical protein
LLNGVEVPLILAATEPIDSIHRLVNTYPHLLILMVDIDAAIPGEVDEQTGAVTFAATPSGDVHDVTDEVARRAWLSGARILGVRDQDIPGPGALAAILRYPL